MFFWKAAFFENHSLQNRFFAKLFFENWLLENRFLENRFLENRFLENRFKAQGSLSFAPLFVRILLISCSPLGTSAV